MIKKISNHSLYREHRGFKHGEAAIFVTDGKCPPPGEFYKVLLKSGKTLLLKKTSMFQQNT